jgi:hypothetical protein
LHRQVKFFEIVASVPVEDSEIEFDNQRIRPALDHKQLIDELTKLVPEAPDSDDPPDDAAASTVDGESGSAFFTGRNRYSMHSRVHRSAAGPDVFQLARVRVDEGGMPVVNQRTGAYREIALSDDEGFAEESHVAFFPNNVLAVVSNGQGAPGVTRIEEYLQNRFDWDGTRISIVAIIPPQRMSQIARENAYTRAARVRLPATSWRLVDRPTIYSDVAAMAEERYGEGVVVDLTIKVPTRGAQDTADAVFRDFQAVAADGNAEALTLTYQDRETERNQAVNLVNDVLTYTAVVTVTREEDDNTALVFSGASTSRALGEAYDRLEELIEAATRDE